MPDFRTIFRSCPNCGKRFEIRLAGKKLVKEEAIKTTEQELSGVPTYGLYGVQQVTTVSEERPVVVDVEEFQYAYECKHCGHKWCELREEEKTERIKEK
ncbi:MAG: hypothetical protein M1587_00495 [Thaumarchaeota archaeon]|nr:hypothetical protein [Nitrososphaerota archaeon]MDG6908413.1 hypothetical protein [Nitrososphaerota archaeon]